MTTTAEHIQLREQFQQLSRRYVFAMQFFAESARVEKEKRRAGDRERLQAIRQTADYEKAFSDTNPLISIIIPTYSRAQIVIERTIPSVLAQTHNNWEVIIVGDRMAEAEAARLAEIDHPRIRFVNLKKRGRYPTEKGPLWYVAGIKPMNFGLRIARGEWIAHLDDDDEFMPDHLEKLLSLARQQHAEWAHSKVRFLDDNGIDAGTVGSPLPREGSIARISSIYHHKLKTFRYNQGAWKYFSPGDWDLWDRFLSMGVRHTHLPLITAIHHGAIERVDEAISTAPPMSALDKGIAFYQNQQPPEAIDALTRTIELDPGQPLAYAYLAFICADQGLHDEAASFIEQACCIAPERHDLLAALGEAFLKAGNGGEAQKYLAAALQKQPDMFMAYPALAEAMRLNGDAESAIQLLASAAGIASNAQENILTGLIEMLTQKGDLGSLAETCVRVRSSQSIHSLAIRLLMRSGANPERLAEEQAWHQANFLPVTPTPLAPRKQAGEYLNIAFLISDFEREAQIGRLESLLQYLPPASFRTIVIDNDVDSSACETAQRCSLLADCWEIIREQDDRSAGQTISRLQPDILIDFDGHGPRQRLALLCQSNTPLRASWSDGPLGKIPEIAWIAPLHPGNDATSGNNEIHLAAPGEILRLPDITCTKSNETTTFGCLTAAIQVNEKTWKLYAGILARLPGSRLRINLDKLDTPARTFISEIFTQQGVATERLEFIHAAGALALCKEWRSISVGLAAPHVAGELALSTCLWMNTPCVALAPTAPWTRRPATLLGAIGHPEFIAGNEGEYQEIALRLAATPPQLDLRHAIRTAGLCDAARFAEEFGNTICRAYFGDTQ